MTKINFLNPYLLSRKKRFKIKKRIAKMVVIILLGVLSTGILWPDSTSSAATVVLSSAVVLTPFEGEQIDEPRPLITGIARNRMHIDVYIDNLWQGRAKVKDHPLGVASFAFKPYYNLAIGRHTLYIIAWSEWDIFHSPKSKEITFEIVHPYPAPILFDPVINSKTSYDRPWIIGLTKNDSRIEVFIDGKLDGEFKVKNHPSGTANFAWKPLLPLKTGWHSVYTKAQGPDGRESHASKEIVFEVALFLDKRVERAPGLTAKPSSYLGQVPAPVLLLPEIGKVIRDPKPKICGLVFNDYLVKAFIDTKLNSEFTPQPHPSGVTNFSFEPYLPLEKGVHRVWTQAENKYGRQSGRSNELAFLVAPEDKISVFTPQGVRKITPGIKPPKIIAPAATVSEEVLEEKEEPEIVAEEEAIEEKAKLDWLTYALLGLGFLIIVLIIWWIVTARKEKKEGKGKRGEKVKIDFNHPKELPKEEKKKEESKEEVPPPPPPSLGI